jgi:Transposase, Mutator family
VACTGVPAVAAHLDAARADILAFTSFPKAIWRQTGATTQKRLNREIRCRTDVVGIFPGHDALIRLIGAVLVEQNEWTEMRRYIGLDVLARSRTGIAGTAKPEDVPLTPLPPKVPGENHAAPSSHTTPQDVTGRSAVRFLTTRLQEGMSALSPA